MSDIWYMCVYEWYLIPVSLWLISVSFWVISDICVMMCDIWYLCLYERYLIPVSVWVILDSCVLMSCLIPVSVWVISDICVYKWYLCLYELYLIHVCLWVISDICVIMCDIWYLCVFQVRTRWWLLDLEIHSFRWTNIQENSQNPLGTTHGTATCTTTNSTQATPPGRGLERVSVPNTSHFTGIAYASKALSIFATIAVLWIFKMILCAFFFVITSGYVLLVYVYIMFRLHAIVLHGLSWKGLT